MFLIFQSKKSLSQSLYVQALVFQGTIVHVKKPNSGNKLRICYGYILTDLLKARLHKILYSIATFLFTSITRP